MRIIHVSTQKYHPCFLSTVFLQSQIHEVVFIVLNPREDPNYSVISRYDEDGVTYVHLNVRRDFDFSADPKLESAFLKIFKEFSPDVIHVQLFSGVNVLSVLRAGRGISAKKIITLHIHSLFCLSGACFDKGQVCLLNSLEECACENCRLAARRERLSLSKYNQIRKVRCQEIVGQTLSFVAPVGKEMFFDGFWPRAERRSFFITALTNLLNISIKQRSPDTNLQTQGLTGEVFLRR